MLNVGIDDARNEMGERKLAFVTRDRDGPGPSITRLSRHEHTAHSTRGRPNPMKLLNSFRNAIGYIRHRPRSSRNVARSGHAYQPLRCRRSSFDAVEPIAVAEKTPAELKGALDTHGHFKVLRRNLSGPLRGFVLVYDYGTDTILRVPEARCPAAILEHSDATGGLTGRSAAAAPLSQ